MTTIETLAVLHSALSGAWTRDLLIDLVLNQTDDIHTDPREIRAEIDRLKHLGYLTIAGDGIVRITAQGRDMLAGETSRLRFLLQKLVNYR